MGEENAALAIVAILVIAAICAGLYYDSGDECGMLGDEEDES